MGTPRKPLPRTGGFAFVVIAWLLLSLVSGGGVLWAVSQAQAAEADTEPTDSGSAPRPTSERSGSAPRPTSERSDSAPAPRRMTTTTTTTTPPPQDSHDPYMQGWVLVIGNCFQSECSYVETYDRAAAKWHPADFEVIDSSRYPGLRSGVWAVVARDRVWASRAAAQAACRYYGLEAGGECYGRNPSTPD